VRLASAGPSAARTQAEDLGGAKDKAEDAAARSVSAAVRRAREVVRQSLQAPPTTPKTSSGVESPPAGTTRAAKSLQRLTRRHSQRTRVATCFGALALAAVTCLSIAGPAAAQPSEHPFEILPGSFHFTPVANQIASRPDQAAAHSDWVTSFDFAHVESGKEAGKTYNDVRTTIVNLPAGFLGNNTAVPTCTDAQLIQHVGERGLASGCPIGSQVGQISIYIHSPTGEQVTFPLYNMEVTSFGTAAELGFNINALIVQILPITVRPGNLGLTVTSPNIQKIGEARDVTVTTWGVPASHEHDAQRGEVCDPLDKPENPCQNEFGGPQEARIPIKPFLSNPTSCGPFLAEIESDSWEEPETFSAATAEVGPIDECDRVPFEPTIEANPTTSSAESPTGLNASLIVPQTYENPNSIATANLKDAVVTLPEGFSLNPSAGSGLGVCTEAQLARETAFSPPGAGCPPESKIGSVEVETPLLTEKAQGAVYVAKPFDNPFHSLLALYIVAKIPVRGIIVSVAGKVTPDPLTGQLTTTFPNNPQVAFSKFTLKFRQGATSPLASPPTCGTYAALADLTPWSAPESPDPLIGNSFQITSGVDAGPCPDAGTPPFHPGLSAGTINNRAGSYSPFYVRLSRQDGEQEITHFSIKLPPGITGKLAGIPYCSDAAIAQAKSREHEGDGALEEASPSCPAASEVGHTLVEAGVGSVLAQAPGKVYLAGPYHGAPISVVSITSAKVGPFDLGTVVVRLGFKINPETAEVFVDGVGSDPIPHIIDGIPTHLRQIRVYMDKPEFVLNPTGCEATSTASTVLGSGTNFVSEADDQPVTASSPFQAADCAALGFKPKLALSLIGGTKRAGNPAFKAVLTARAGDANIGSAQVTLPHSEFLDNAHIKTICTRVVFKEGAIPGEKCPADSVYGFAKAVTPILSEPLEGPVYLRSSSHQLPDLVAALHNKQVDIALDGHVEGVKGGIRNTFEAVPDAPVTKFTLEMQGGNKGLLENSTNLCAAPHRATADFVGHNGKVDDFKPLLAVSCGKHGKKHHKRHGHRAAR
jgi:hypothetical protein